VRTRLNPSPDSLAITSTLWAEVSVFLSTVAASAAIPTPVVTTTDADGWPQEQGKEAYR
jgi:hypothetical protein